MFVYICVSVHHPIYYRNTHILPSIKERVPSLAALLSFAIAQCGSGVNEEPARSSQCLQQLQPGECAEHSACALGLLGCAAPGPSPHGPCEAVEFLLPVEQNGASVIRRFPSRLSCAPQIGLFTSWRIKETVIEEKKNPSVFKYVLEAVSPLKEAFQT